MKKLLVVVSALTLILTGCSTVTSSPDNPDSKENRLVITEVSSDYTTGAFGSIDSNNIHSKGIKIDSDARVFVLNNDTYILERKTANIMRLNSNDSVVYQVHIADNYNPHAIAAVSDSKAYVCGLGSPWVYVINLANGSKADSIDLSAFNNNNSNPGANTMVEVNGSIYVGMQRFEDGSWSPSAPSKIAVINSSTDKITDTVTTIGYKVSQLLVDGNSIIVLNAGDSYGTLEHGTIEKINTTDNSISTVLANTVIGGAPITSLAQQDDNDFYATIYESYGTVPVKLIDITDGSVIKTIDSIKNGFGGIKYRDGKLYVGEFDPATYGIKIYDEATEKTVRVATSLNPSSFTFK